MIAKSMALAVGLLSMTMSCPANALSQDVGEISCDVVSGYVATSPAYREVFLSYLEGYLTSEKNAGKPEPKEDVATLLIKVVDFCKSSRDASFASAVGGVVGR